MKWRKYRLETDEIIKNVELIAGVPFPAISDFLFYKRHLPREKDKKDVKLMERYLLNKNNEKLL
jgi:hypothetical protein